MDIRRLTTPADFAAASRLAYDVYVEECGILGHLADHDTRTLEADTGPVVIFGAFEDDELIGSISCCFWADAPFPAFYEDTFQLRRFDGVAPRETWMIATRLLIRPAHRSGMLSMQLFANAWSLAEARGVQVVFGDCQPHLLGTYRRLGFRSFAPAFDYGNSGVGIPLVAFPPDHEHLRQIRSPGLMLVDPATEDPELAARGRAVLAEPGDPILTRHRDPEAHARQVQELLDNPPPQGSNPFTGFSPEDLIDMLGRGDILELDEGIKLISARQNTRTVYVVLEGELSGRRGTQRFTLGRGEMLGEIAFLTGGERSADVWVSSAKARVLCLDGKIMRRLADEGSRLGARFLRNLSVILATRLVA